MKQKGIVANKANTTKDFILGKISGTKEKLVGAFFKDSQAPVKCKKNCKYRCRS